MLNHAARLKDALGGGVDVEIGRRGQSETVTVNGDKPSPAQIAIINAFDWSEAAHLAWLEDKNPDRKNIRQAAAAAIAANETYIALASPTNAQNAAQIKRLSQQVNHIIKRLIQID
jgi:hypothetical protein